MKDVVRFVSKNKEQDVFAKELSKNVRTYFKEKGIRPEGDYRMIIKAIFMLGLYLAPIVVLFTVDLPAWFGIILLVIMGIGEAGIGMGVMHDAVHGSFSRHNWLNKLMGRTMFYWEVTWLIGGSNTIFTIIHIPISSVGMEILTLED